MTSNRGLKNRTAISTAIDKELYKQLKQYSDDTGIPISKSFDKAISMYLESIKSKWLAYLRLLFGVVFYFYVFTPCICIYH